MGARRNDGIFSRPVFQVIFFLIPFSLTATLVFFADRTILGETNVPPLGRLMSPFYGFWQNSIGEDVAAESSLTMPGLKGTVTVRFDDRLVPHVFAQNDEDLYYAQGYLHARFRLWQMEMQTRAAAGRLSEVLGKKFIDFDRFKRRTGLLEAARQTVKKFENDPKTLAIITAYANGVNAYVDQLSGADYPVEYKLMDFKPERWDPLKTALLLKMMCWDLNSTDTDLPVTNAAAKYGLAATEKLYPNRKPYQDPIIPSERVWDFKPLAIPKAPAQILDTARSGGLAQGYMEQFLGFADRAEPDNGSNNWAVGGDKTRTGYPMIANDPHLNLTLPSIWYEMQLCAPGRNVYGVSLPGAPAIVIGYNERIAWAVTNVGSDVMDWYKIKFKGDSKGEYYHGGEWKRTRAVIEPIEVRGQGVISDTVYYTHHGPVVFPEKDAAVPVYYPVGCALRWQAHEPSNELATLVGLNAAEGYTDYVNALKHWVSPAQNFCYADTRKNIALWVNGKLPLKWAGQGKYILDGSNPAADWQGYIPHDQLPSIKNPKRGFVSSANQFSADSTYPYFLDWDFEVYERGKRINTRLAAMENATTDSLRALQNDNYSLFGRQVTPQILKRIDPAKLNAEQKATLAFVQNWDKQNSPESVGATVFTLWWEMLEDEIWKDEFGEPGYIYPDRDITVQLMERDTASRWFDKENTPARETLNELVLSSFVKAHDSLIRRFPDRKQWNWANWKGTNIRHLARIKGMGSQPLNIGGGQGIVNATKTTHGPSWRMVVSLVPYQVRGFGTYPGGQSGHPGSKYYDNFIPFWEQGKLEPQLFLKSEKEDSKKIIANLTLKN